MNWHYPTSINCGVLSSARWSTGKGFSFWPSYSSSPFPGTAKLLLLSPHPLPTPPQAWLHLLPLPLTPGISLEAPAQSPRQWSAYVSGVHSADNCTPQDLQMLVLRPFRWYKRTKRESYTIYCIPVNVGGSIECRSCGRENRDEAVPQTPQNRGVHVVHLRKAVLEKKVGRVLQVLMCCPHSWRDPDMLAIGLSCVYPRCAHAGESYRKGAWKRGAGKQETREKAGRRKLRLTFLQAGALFCLSNFPHPQSEPWLTTPRRNISWS